MRTATKVIAFVAALAAIFAITLGIGNAVVPMSSEPATAQDAGHCDGHLVALRAGDLAYLHVHPDGTPDDGSTQPGPDVVFYATVPSSGTYHLYLDFQHQDEVRTAAFTVTTDGHSGH
ncbi:MAG: hypothetical protein ACR2HA_07015 [Nocardioides sp.]